MLRTTMGRLLVHSALPPEHRSLDTVLDKQGVTKLLREIATREPDRYVEIAKELADIGRRVSTITGGNSFGLAHLTKAKAAVAHRDKLRNQLREILNNDNLTEEQRHEQIVHATGKDQAKQMDDILAESLAEGNPLADQAISGSRGNKMNMASLRGSDLLYVDHKDRVIPVPVLSSYSEGLRPFEYWAGTYGARKGVLDVKMSVARAGYLSKVLNQLSHRLLVVGDDADQPHREHIGLPTTVTDADNDGALLARDAGPYKRNTPLTPKIRADLERRGIEHILVRSPAVGGPAGGGVYARDAGIRERGVLPGIGEPVGLTASQSLSEPISQAQLQSKHTGGVAGQGKAVGGFAGINQQINVPSSFQGATHALADGVVAKIEDAPAGGVYVHAGGERHYVPHGVPLRVKVGDEVEAGDRLSEGAANPQVVTKFKGIGEGRREFVKGMLDALKNANTKGHRRNIELLARGLIDHVRINAPIGEHLPDDVIPYSDFAHTYEPREGTTRRTGSSALGQYLEEPVLHYTIGTKIRPSVLKELDRFGVKDIAVHKEPPPFEPEMIRGTAVIQHDPDWQTRMYGAGQKASLLDAAHRGATSDAAGTSFVPSLAEGVNFGRIGKVRAPAPGKTPPPEGQPFGDEEDAVNRKPRPLDVTNVPRPSALRPLSRLGSFFKVSLDEMAAQREADEVLSKLANDFMPHNGMNQGPMPSMTPHAGGGSAAPSTAMPQTPQLRGLGPTAVHTPQIPQHQPVQQPMQPTQFGETPFARNPHLAGFAVQGMQQLGQHFGMGDMAGAIGLGTLLNPSAMATLTQGPAPATPTEQRNALRPQPRAVTGPAPQQSFLQEARQAAGLPSIDDLGSFAEGVPGVSSAASWLLGRRN